MNAKFRRLISVIVPALLLAAAVYILHHHTRGITWASLREAFAGFEKRQIILCALATLTSFIGLGAYDVFAVRTAAPGRVTLWTAGFAGMTGSAVSNTLGFHLVTGGAVRYRLYRQKGFSLGDVSRITALSMAGLGLGYICILITALFFDPHPAFSLPSRAIAVAMAAGLGAFLWWLAHTPRRLDIGKWHVPFPNAASAVQQMAVGFVEMGAAMMALYVLMPADLLPPLASFAFVYIATLIIGVASHAPGGIGIFEAGMMSALGASGRSDMLAALLVYRAIYNFSPFALALAALLIREGVQRLSSRADRH